MTKAQGEKIRYIYGIVLSAFSVFVGVLFIVQVWSIYRSAPQSPYTVENVAKHFKQIAIPVWLWVAAVFGNILLAYVFPEKEKRPKACVDMAVSIDRAKKQMANYEGLLEQTSATGKKEQNFRTLVCVVCLVIVLAMVTFGALILFGVAYQTLIKTEFFTAHDGVVDKLVQCVILSVFTLAFVCVCVYLNANSRKREKAYYQKETIKALQAQKAAANGEKAMAKKQLSAPAKTQEKGETMGVWYVRGAILTVALVLIVVGIINGGMGEVFLKAINICTQCIGLG